MASKGVAVTLGVNNVDASQHGTRVPPLSGCHNDARQMAAFLEKLGYAGPDGGRVPVLLDRDADSEGLTRVVKKAAEIVGPGDIFVCHISGHGAEMPGDPSKDEADGKDSALVLYDRLFLDDEMFNLWTYFPAGARIVFVADTCHSGTMARPVFDADADDLDPVGVREVDAVVVKELIAARQSNYDELRQTVARDRDGRAKVRADLIQLAACQDEEVAFDLKVNGVFTRSLLQVLEGGRADRYQALLEETAKAVRGHDLPRAQRPNLISIADPTAGLIAFMMQKPFTIAAP